MRCEDISESGMHMIPLIHDSRFLRPEVRMLPYYSSAMAVEEVTSM
jgi:hypothetical protein